MPGVAADQQSFFSCFIFFRNFGLLYGCDFGLSEDHHAGRLFFPTDFQFTYMGCNSFTLGKIQDGNFKVNRSVKRSFAVFLFFIEDKKIPYKFCIKCLQSADAFAEILQSTEEAERIQNTICR